MGSRTRLNFATGTGTSTGTTSAIQNRYWNRYHALEPVPESVKCEYDHIFELLL